MKISLVFVFFLVFSLLFNGALNYVWQPVFAVDNSPHVLSSVKIDDSTVNGPVLTNYDYFGYSIANIGDIDKDGVNDIAVGAKFDDTGGADRGAVYIIKLNADSTVKSTTKIASSTANGPVLLNGDLFGSSIANIGDIDRDGVNDIAVGAYSDDTGGADRGAVYIIKLNADSTVKSTTKIDSSTANGPVLTDSDYFGYSIANIGDIDKDGVNDIAVGAVIDDTGGLNRGAVYIIKLNANSTVKSTTKIASSTANGPVLLNGDLFGSSIANIGDIDRDGVNDIAVGAYSDDTGGLNRGAVYIIKLNADSTVKSTTKIASSTVNGPVLTDSDYFGSSIANIGDIDRDGVNDIAVGAFGDDTGDADRGAVYIINLNSNGMAKSTTKIDDLTANGPVLTDSDYFGYSIANIGDINRDGISDIVVGAYGDETGGTDRGAIHIITLTANTVFSNDKVDSFTTIDSTSGGGFYYGNAIANIGDINRDGVNDIAVSPIRPTTASCTECGRVDLIKLNAIGTLQSINYIQSGTVNFVTLTASDYFGSSIANIGDIDRDGVNDIAVGAMFDDTGGTNRGAVYIINLNADSTVKSTTKIDDLTANGPVLADLNSFGQTIANIGDIDRDGVNDIAVGVLGDNTGGTNRGAVYIIKLNANSTVKSTTKIDSSTANGPVLVNSDSFGYSIANIGDIDRDGVNDIAVGAKYDDTGGTDRGAVYIIKLNANSTVKSTTKIDDSTANGPVLANGDFFSASIANIGDIDRDGVNDIAVGADDDDTGGTDRGAVYIIKLNADSTVKSTTKIASTTANLSSQWGLSTFTHFGTSIANVGDLNGDGVDDMVVGEIQNLSRVVFLFMTRLTDAIKPTYSSATLDLNTKVLSITFSESVNFALDRSKLFISSTGITNELALTGATITTSANGATISMTITDAQKTSIAAMTSPQLDIQALAATDLTGNTINDAANNAITVTADSTKPTFTSATFNKGTGLLVLQFSESLDNTPTSDINLSNLFISETGTIDQVPLTGATITPVGDNRLIYITLTEDQRDTVFTKTIPQLDISADAVKDIVGNTILAVANSAITVTADSTKPTFTSATLHKGTGILAITFSEVIDNIPITEVDLSKIYLSQSGTVNEIVLTGGTITTVGSNQIISITLTEDQRQLVIPKTAPQLDILADAVNDPSGNTILAVADRTITVTADSTKPTFTSAIIDRGTGVLSITFSEVIDNTPTSDVNLGNLFISESGKSNQHALTEATVAAGNSTIINITLTADQLTNLLAKTIPQLDISALAVKDTSGNTINAITDRPITVPATPAQVVQSAIPSDGKVLLSWSAPSSGGSAITDYKIFKSTNNILWTLFNDGVSTSTSGVITGLTNNILQYFKVSAVNSNGAGINSTVTSATPIAVSSLVSNVVATGGAKSVSLSWSATDPSITDYTVEYSADGSTWDIYDDDESTSTSTTVTELDATSNYFFRVSPVLTCIESTSASTITTTLPSTPLQITKLIPTPGNNQMSLLWSAPNNGGSAITDYIIQQSSDGNTFTTFVDAVSTETTATVTGLTNGATYHFKVAGINTVGTGTYSESAASIPVSSYSAPADGTLAIATYDAFKTFNDNQSFSSNQVFSGMQNFGSGTSFNSGTQFAQNQVFTGAQTFGAGNVFASNTKFVEGQAFTNTATFGAGMIFGAGTKFAAGQAFNSDFNFKIERPEFAAGSTFSNAEIFGKMAKFVGHQNFVGANKFSSDSVFGANQVFSGTQTFAGNTTFTQGTEFAANQVFKSDVDVTGTLMKFSSGTKFCNAETFGTSANFTGAQNFATGNTFGASTIFGTGQTFSSTQTFGNNNAFGNATAFTTPFIFPPTTALNFTSRNIEFTAASNFGTARTFGMATNFGVTQTFKDSNSFDTTTKFAANQMFPNVSQSFGTNVQFGKFTDFNGTLQTFSQGAKFDTGTTFAANQPMPANAVLSYGMLLEPITCPNTACTGVDSAKIISKGEKLLPGVDPAAVGSAISPTNKLVTIPGMGFNMTFANVSNAGSVSADLMNPSLVPGATASSDGTVSMTNGATTMHAVSAITDVSLNSTSGATVSGFMDITLSYDDTTLGGIAETDLKMLHYTNGAWIAENNCSVNTNTNSITCTVSSLSPFGIGASSSSSSSSSDSSGGGVSNTISMSGKSFDYSFAINDQKSLLDKFTSIIPSYNTTTNTPVKFITIIHDTEGPHDIEMVGLYLCLDRIDVFSNSDCFVEWYNNGKKIIHDPNGMFTVNGITSKIIKDNKLQVEFDITFDKPLISSIAVQSWDTDRDFILRYIPDGIILSEMIPAEITSEDIPSDIPTNKTKYISPSDIAIQKANDIILQKQKAADIVAANLAEKQAAEKSRLESLEMKNNRLLHEKEIIKEALKISAQRLEQAISDSKQKIDSMKQVIPDNVQIQIFAAIEMETISYEKSVREYASLELQKTLSEFKAKKAELYSLYPNIANKIVDESGNVNYDELFEMEKNRMMNKVLDDVISADMTLLEKMQNEIKVAQERISNTLNYYQETLEKSAQAAESHRKSLEYKKVGD